MDGRGSQVWAKDGLGGFWRGNLTNTLSSAPGKAIDFFSYALFKEMFTKVREHSRGTSLQRGRRCETRHDQGADDGLPKCDLARHGSIRRQSQARDQGALRGEPLHTRDGSGWLSGLTREPPAVGFRASASPTTRSDSRRAHWRAWPATGTPPLHTRSSHRSTIPGCSFPVFYRALTRVFRAWGAGCSTRWR
jgi:hypothetical protein